VIKVTFIINIYRPLLCIVEAYPCEADSMFWKVQQPRLKLIQYISIKPNIEQL